MVTHVMIVNDFMHVMIVNENMFTGSMAKEFYTLATVLILRVS